MTHLSNDIPSSESGSFLADHSLEELERIVIWLGHGGPEAQALIREEAKRRASVMADAAIRLAFMSSENNEIYGDAADRLVAAIDSLGLRDVINQTLLPEVTAEMAKRARQLAGLTLDETAQHIGISMSYLSRLESGDRDNPEHLLKAFEFANEVRLRNNQ